MENISMDLKLASFAEKLSFLIWAGKFGMTKVKLFICFILSNVMHTETTWSTCEKKTLDSWEFKKFTRIDFSWREKMNLWLNWPRNKKDIEFL